jgi:hypothetical protein
MAGMLTIARRRVMIVVAALGALFSVACAGGDDHQTYSASDADVATLDAPVPVASTCQAGAVKSCTIWLGATGDLANCAKGVALCSEGAWSECIDEETVAENPELYAAMTGEVDSAE